MCALRMKRTKGEENSRKRGICGGISALSYLEMLLQVAFSIFNWRDFVNFFEFAVKIWDIVKSAFF